MSDFRQRERSKRVAEIRLALARHDGNKAAAARELGMNRTTLHERMRVLGLLGEPVESWKRDVTKGWSDEDWIDAVLSAMEPIESRAIRALKQLAEDASVSARHGHCSYPFADHVKHVVAEALEEVA